MFLLVFKEKRKQQETIFMVGAYKKTQIYNILGKKLYGKI